MIVPYFLSTIASMAAITIAGYLEVWILGKGANTTGNLAAFGSVSTIQAWITAVAYFFAMGTGCVVAGNKQGTSYLKGNVGLLTGAVVGVILGVTFFFLPEKWVFILGANRENASRVFRGISVLGLASPALILAHTYGTVFRGLGKKVISSLGLTFMGVSQAGVSFFLVQWGMDSFFAVIWGLVVSQILTAVLFSAFWIWTLLHNRKGTGSKARRNIWMDTIREILKAGIPSLARQGSISVGLWATNVIAGRYGAGVQSLLAAGGRFMTLPFGVVIAVCQAYQPIASAKMEDERANKEEYYVSRRFGAWITSLVALGILIAGRSLLKIIPGEYAGKEAIMVIIVSQTLVLPLVMYTQLVITHFQVCKEWKAGIILATLRNGIIYVPILWLLNSVAGIWGLLLSQSLVDIMDYPIGYRMMQKRGHFGKGE